MPIADSSEITLEELQLSGRNHSIPLEALRHDVTPIGLHYLLIHFDIPHVDAETWRLEIGGLVEKPLTLSLDDVKARPARTTAVTLECAGNGRALTEPRPLSQPWLEGAVGTAEWTGTPLAPPAVQSDGDLRSQQALRPARSRYAAIWDVGSRSD